jgi:hypothetical protein
MRRIAMYAAMTCLLSVWTPIAALAQMGACCNATGGCFITTHAACADGTPTSSPCYPVTWTSSGTCTPLSCPWDYVDANYNPTSSGGYHLVTNWCNANGDHDGGGNEKITDGAGQDVFGFCTDSANGIDYAPITMGDVGVFGLKSAPGEDGYYSSGDGSWWYVTGSTAGLDHLNVAIYRTKDFQTFQLHMYAFGTATYSSCSPPATPPDSWQENVFDPATCSTTPVLLYTQEHIGSDVFQGFGGGGGGALAMFPYGGNTDTIHFFCGAYMNLQVPLKQHPQFKTQLHFYISKADFLSWHNLDATNPSVTGPHFSDHCVVQGSPTTEPRIGYQRNNVITNGLTFDGGLLQGHPVPCSCDISLLQSASPPGNLAVTDPTRGSAWAGGNFVGSTSVVGDTTITNNCNIFFDPLRPQGEPWAACAVYGWGWSKYLSNTINSPDDGFNIALAQLSANSLSVSAPLTIDALTGAPSGGGGIKHLAYVRNSNNKVLGIPAAGSSCACSTCPSGTCSLDSGAVAPGETTGSCCVGSTCIAAVLTADCRSPMGYHGTIHLGGSCSPNPCAHASGACCNGVSCTSTTSSACSTGDWTGGGVCSPSPCASLPHRYFVGENYLGGWAEEPHIFFNWKTRCYYIVYARNWAPAYELVYRKLHAVDGKRFVDLAFENQQPPQLWNYRDAQEKLLIGSEQLDTLREPGATGNPHNFDQNGHSFGGASVFAIQDNGAGPFQYYLAFHAQCDGDSRRTVFFKELTFKTDVPECDPTYGDILQLHVASSDPRSDIHKFIMPNHPTVAPWMVVGDTNGDGAIDCADAAAAASAWGHSSPDALYRAELDFNHDGVLDQSDKDYFDSLFDRSSCPAALCTASGWNATLALPSSPSSAVLASTMWNPPGSALGQLVVAYADTSGFMVTRWDGEGTGSSHWHLLGKGTGSVNALTTWHCGDVNPVLIVGGNFTRIYSADGTVFTNANSIAQWNGSSWMALGAGIQQGASVVRSLATDPMNGNLCVGGNFLMAGDVNNGINCLAEWDGTTWHSVGGGVSPGPVFAICADSYGHLVVGGSFTQVNGSAFQSPDIAIWNGVSWSPLNSGLLGSASVRSLARLGPDIIAGGNFTGSANSSSSHLNTPNIARWHALTAQTGTWQALGNAPNARVDSLQSLADGSLLAGGEFTLPASGVARWTTSSTWQSLGAGVIGDVYSIITLPSGEYVFTGAFNTAGPDAVQDFARWFDSCPGACCKSDNTCVLLQRSECDSAVGIYRGDATACSTSCPLGACCQANNMCAPMSPSECTSMSGAYQGDGTACSTACPTGACCNATNGICTSVNVGACSGTWSAGACTPTYCPQPGTCCNSSGVCSFLLQSACASGSTWTQSGSCMSTNPCQLTQLGTCCAASGSCSSSLQTACASGSVWTQGATCTSNPCPQPGFCCDIAGSCTFTPLNACATSSGSVWTQGGSCAPNPCVGVCCRGATCNTTFTLATCTVSGLGTAGAVFSSAATVCNAGPVSSSPCCYADYNKVGSVTVQDIFDFLSDWFGGRSFAKTGSDGTAATLSVQNIFDFLSAWFAGC